MIGSCERLRSARDSQIKRTHLGGCREHRANGGAASTVVRHNKLLQGQIVATCNLAEDERRDTCGRVSLVAVLLDDQTLMRTTITQFMHVRFIHQEF